MRSADRWEPTVDDEQARTLLSEERHRVQALLDGLRVDRRDDRAEADVSTNWSDPAQSITAEGTDDAVAESLQDRLRAIERAEQRLSEGRFGLSIRSGAPIPDERLEADPAAELTVEEAAAEP